MTEFLTMEIKSDLESAYNLTGELLNTISMKDFSFSCRKDEIREMMEFIKFRLMDIGSILQKDILNCDYLLDKMKTSEPRKSEVKVVNAYMN